VLRHFPLSQEQISSSIPGKQQFRLGLTPPGAERIQIGRACQWDSFTMVLHAGKIVHSVGNTHLHHQRF